MSKIYQAISILKADLISIVYIDPTEKIYSYKEQHWK